MWPVGALLALTALTSASAAAPQRPNPGECVAPNADVNLAQLASNLGSNSVECSSDEECMFKVRRSIACMLQA
jgi:hypothetical protein